MLLALLYAVFVCLLPFFQQPQSNLKSRLANYLPKDILSQFIALLHGTNDQITHANKRVAATILPIIREQKLVPKRILM